MTKMHSLLLVEDNPNVLDLALIALEPFVNSFAISSVRDGEEALAYLRREGAWRDRSDEDPALILMDVKLPKITGLEVVQQIRQTPQISRLPVVALTSSREVQDLRRCYESGVNAFVIKPKNFDKFSELLSCIASFWLRLNGTPQPRTA